MQDKKHKSSQLFLIAQLNLAYKSIYFVIDIHENFHLVLPSFTKHYSRL